MHMQYKVDPDDALARPRFGSLFLLTAIVGLLVVGDLVCYALGYERLRNPAGLNLALLAAIIGGARIIYGALAALLEGDLGADLALAIALLAALLLGEYWVGAEVVLIAMIGESLEALTFARTHRELHRILELRPRRVRVRRGDAEVEIPADQVQVGDTLVVRPGERIAVDGTVLVGRSAVDQSMLTGESLPVDKGAGDPIFAGSMNQFGALEIRADVVGAQTSLGQIIQLVAEAQHHKAKIERTADRLARYFLPFVLTCAGATFLYSNFVQRGLTAEPGSQWIWMPTLAVLVVTCPCALILATPAAMMAALAWLARRGVLIKGGVALERLATVTHLAFDKTGTLTAGRLELVDCTPLDGGTADELLTLAASAEAPSEHLIGKAIVGAAHARGCSLLPTDGFEALPGAGVRVRLSRNDGQFASLLLGNRRLMAENEISIDPAVEAAVARLEAAGQSPLLVAIDGRVSGVLGLRDTVRPEAAAVIGRLRELGIEDFAMLTGDRPAAARQVAAAVGISQIEAELRPAEKAQWLAAWRRRAQAGSQRPVRVGMVGDGINDAPALASADVGVALAGIGCDLAAEAGDLVILGEPLAHLPSLVLLARETVRVIRQNILLFAFFVNFLGIVLTAWILPGWSPAWHRRAPIAAAVFHQFGSVLVLLNSMRLLWFERYSASWLGRLEALLAEAIGRAAGKFAPAVRAAEFAWQMRWPLVRAGATLALLAYLAQVVVIVEPDEVALVRRFGRFFAVLEPGPHLRLPPPWDTITREQPDRVRTLHLGLRPEGETSATAAIEWNTPHQVAAARGDDEGLAITGDQSLVELGAVIQYRIRDIRAFRFGTGEPERVLQALAEGVLRETLAVEPLLAEPGAVGQGSARPGEDILTTGRGAIEARTQATLQARADVIGLGVEFLAGGVCFQDVHPPLAVVPAFRDVSSAFKEKERMGNEANGYYRETVIKAGGRKAWQDLEASGSEVTDATWNALQEHLEGDAAREVLAAQAEAIDRQEAASGEAARFLLTEAAQTGSPQLTRWRLLLDTLCQALPGKRKLMIDSPPGVRRHLLLGAPSGGLLPLAPLVAEPPQED
jgi:Cu+-exporting ATPase